MKSLKTFNPLFKMATFEDFEKLDIRTGKIINVQDFPEAKKPSFKLFIDFGEMGIKKSSAQIVARYSKTDLLNKVVLAVVNIPPRQIGTFYSEVLTLGVSNKNGEVVLISPDEEDSVALGSKLF